jgi:hypothetical protein
VTDSAETTSSEAVADSSQPVAASAPSWTPEPSAQESAIGAAAERPEIMVGAAFAGGLLLAMILKRLAR